MTIYSIGYGNGKKITHDVLRRIVDHLGATIVDVRQRPWSRWCAWSRRVAMEASFGDAYRWHGDVLGSSDWEPVGPALQAQLADGLAILRGLQADGRTVLLLCAESRPWECHRHMVIASCLLPDVDVEHICVDPDGMFLLRASEIELVIDSDADPETEPFELPEED